MKARNPKAKVFGTFAVDEEGTEILIGYAEAFTKPSAQKKVLDARLITREASTRDMIAIGRDGTPVDWMDEDADDQQPDLPGVGEQ